MCVHCPLLSVCILTAAERRVASEKVWAKWWAFVKRINAAKGKGTGRRMPDGLA